MSSADEKDPPPIATLFLELSVELPSPDRQQQQLRERIESVLKSYGEPLRWAITAVNDDTQSVQIEAVVTRCGAAS
ncbi:MAG: hypothetical protein AAFU78_14645 [Cyanobacteria bacterium J06633_2]